MPFAFLIVALFLIVIAVRNQTANAVTLMKSEFTGPHSFIQWFLAISVIGSVGYIKPIKPVADAFLFLILLVMIISDQNKNGIFAKFQDALQNTQPITNVQTTSAVSSTSSAASAGALGFGNPLTTAGAIAFPSGQQSLLTDQGIFNGFPSGGSSKDPLAQAFGPAFPSGLSSVP